MARRPADAKAQGWLPYQLWPDIAPVSLQSEVASTGPHILGGRDRVAHRSMCMIVTLKTLVLQYRRSMNSGLAWWSA